MSDRYEKLIKAINLGQIDAGVHEFKELVQAGNDVFELFDEVITPCLKSIGDRFSKLEIYLPEMMASAEVVKAIQGTYQSEFEATMQAKRAGRVVIATVYGDIHDIGKNIVASMLEINGFEVVDLGVDVPTREIVKRSKDVGADIIALSCLLSTSIPYMADLIELVRTSQGDGDLFKILIGGGPVTSEIASRISADGYGKDAADAVNQARRLLEQD
jgi:methylmalonyl-CoA mutase cobalamin-binding domain/chain